MRTHKSLNSVIIKAFLSILLESLLFIMIIVVLSLVAFGSNWLLPANFGEKNIEQQIHTLEESEPTAENIHPFYDYVILDDNYAVEEAMMGKTDIAHAKKLANGTETATRYNGKIFQVVGHTVITYSIKARYNSHVLNRYLPSYELSAIILIVINLLIFATFTARKITNIIKANLNPLLEMSNKIAQQELDFDVSSSNIAELDTLNQAFEHMRTALSTSLEHEWRKDVQRKEQISALAHDIKTPITIISANAELLLSDSTTVETAEGIMDSCSRIRVYMDKLIQLSNRVDLGDDKLDVYLPDFFNRVVKKAEIIGNVKGQKITYDWHFEVKIFNLNEIDIERAIMNLVENACESSNHSDEISLFVSATESELTIYVRDHGTGFTAEALNSASEFLYRHQKERQNDGHYGIGLYAVNKIVESHGGELVIANNEQGPGANIKMVLK